MEFSSVSSARTTVLSRVRAACERAGRPADSVRVIAVSKLQPVSRIEALYAEGQRDFGENYVQEFATKHETLAATASDVRWHLIGHLQKNKIKFVTGRCAMIHSVDSVALAEAIGRRAEAAGSAGSGAAAGVAENILLQVNVGGEGSKEGFSPTELRESIAALTTLPGLRLCGLMTMPPLQNEAEANRVHFRELRTLLDDLRPQVTTSPSGPHPWNELSMGTSHDFEIAIEEGATLIRVGTILFGERPSPKREKTFLPR